MSFAGEQLVRSRPSLSEQTVGYKI